MLQDNRLEILGADPFSVSRNGYHLCALKLERLKRPKVRRRLHRHPVTTIHEHARDQVDGLLGASRYKELKRIELDAPLCGTFRDNFPQWQVSFAVAVLECRSKRTRSRTPRCIPQSIQI